MEVIKETLWKRCLSTPTKPPAKNSNKFLSETAYQHKGTRKKCKKTNQAAISQWQRQCLMYKPHRKPRPKSKTSDISKQSPSPLHHTFLLGRARFTAQPLSALVSVVQNSVVVVQNNCKGKTKKRAARAAEVQLCFLLIRRKSMLHVQFVYLLIRSISLEAIFILVSV